MSAPTPRLVLTTLLALSAFAGNSVLCRLALVEPALDPASFSAIRVCSGAAFLAALLFLKGKSASLGKPDVAGAVWLSAYAIPFSYAYVELSTGTGALILFGSVQICMLLFAVLKGERLTPKRWLGLAVAFCGLVILILPGVTAPSAQGSLLMTVAGVSWGIYSLHGRHAKNATLSTARNFLWATPLVAIVCLAQLSELHASAYGVWLAVASGVLASGLGYTLWYAALPMLSRAGAAALQLCVPVLAAAYGVLFMAEALTSRLVLSTVLVLAGVGLALAKHKGPGPRQATEGKAGTL